MSDRIHSLGTAVFATPEAQDLPSHVAKIVRLWGELALVDRALALELARKLPDATIIDGRSD